MRSTLVFSILAIVATAGPAAAGPAEDGATLLGAFGFLTEGTEDHAEGAVALTGGTADEFLTTASLVVEMEARALDQSAAQPALMMGCASLPPQQAGVCAVQRAVVFAYYLVNA